MQNGTKERIIAQIKERQDKYVDGQLDLYDRILKKVEIKYENSISYTVLNNIAVAVYQGYILSDIEDAVRGITDEPRKI